LLQVSNSSGRIFLRCIIGKHTASFVMDAGRRGITFEEGKKRFRLPTSPTRRVEAR